MALLLGIASLPNAGAAESASEILDEHGQRQFAGADRYATAVALALAVWEARPVNSAIVASGESLVDATAAASLAAIQGSVVLLTRPNELPPAVADFISMTGLSEVTIVGGPAAVLPRVEAQLAQLNRVNRVSRVFGADRYETAVAIAAQAVAPGSFCGIERAVFLVGGGSLVDAIAAGPYAYAMGMPILFTESGGLPSAVSSYLRGAGIQRAVVVGDLNAVSTAVDGQLREAGIVHPWRIAGPDAPTRAVGLLEAVATCGETTISPDTVALVDGTVPIDGTTAAAILGTGFRTANTVVPILVVSEPLPTAVQQYLAPTRPAGEGPAYQHLHFLPLGGVGRLTPTLLASAIEAAVPPPPPTVLFSRYSHLPSAAHLGYCVQLIDGYVASFSTAVDPIDAMDIRNYTINGEQVNGGSVSQLSPTSYLLHQAAHYVGGIGRDYRDWGSRLTPDSGYNTMTLGVRRNGIRTTDGRSISHRHVTALAPVESRPPESPMVFAVASNDGRDFEILMVGGPGVYGGYTGPFEVDNPLEASEVTMVVGDQRLPLTDTEHFRRGNNFYSYCGGGGEGSGTLSYSFVSVGARVRPGDAVLIDAGAITGASGASNEHLTVPFTFWRDREPQTIGNPVISVLDEPVTSNALPVDVVIEPYFNYPPLKNAISTQCINHTNQYVAKFSRAIHGVDATIQSSYELRRGDEATSAIVSKGDGRWVWGTIFTGGPSASVLSPTEVRLEMELVPGDRVAVRPFTIRAQYWGYVGAQTIVPTLHKAVEGQLDAPMVAVAVDKEGKELTVFWAGVGRDFAYPVATWHRGKDNPRLNSDAADELEFLDPDMYWVDNCVDYDNPSGFTTRRLPSDTSTRIAPGDELVFPAETLWHDRNGRFTYLPEMRIQVQSLEDLQAAASS